MDVELRSTFGLENDIYLRAWKETDADLVFNAVENNRDHLQAFMHWMSPDYSFDSARDFVAAAVEAAANRESIGYGIFRGGNLTGSIGFVYFDWHSRRTEIGYWIAKGEEGKGIVSAAARRLISYAFDELDINRIEIRCSAENIRSEAIPVRLGFQKEGHLRQFAFRNGKLHDFVVYGLLADDPRLW